MSPLLIILIVVLLIGSLAVGVTTARTWEVAWVWSCSFSSSWY